MARLLFVHWNAAARESTESGQGSSRIMFSSRSTEDRATGGMLARSIRLILSIIASAAKSNTMLLPGGCAATNRNISLSTARGTYMVTPSRMTKVR